MTTLDYTRCVELVADGYLRAVARGDQRSQAFLARLRRAAGKPGQFILALGSTASSDLPGISAAGATAADRRLTPAIDAEALILGRPRTRERLPVSPAGIVSPVVITRAALKLSDIPTKIVECGSFHTPAIPYEGTAFETCAFETAGEIPARCLSTGRAMSRHRVEELFRHGLKCGRRLAQTSSYALLAECVPGGTTTAQAVLLALGHDVSSLMSSSLPLGNHNLKRELIQKGLANSGLSAADFRSDPLLAAAALGDPMQPYLAGVLLGAGRAIPVVLAGGTQMLAVLALAAALPEFGKLPLDSVAVITTKWVLFDRNANAGRIASMIDVPFIAACPDFSRSRHPGLQAYEDGHVKEGVGAGAALALAYLKGSSPATIQSAIDSTYDEMVV